MYFVYGKKLPTFICQNTRKNMKTKNHMEARKIRKDGNPYLHCYMHNCNRASSL